MTAIGIPATAITCSTITVAVLTCAITIAAIGVIAVNVGTATIAAMMAGAVMGADVTMTTVVADAKTTATAIRALQAMATGMAGTTIVTTDAVVVAMAAADATTAKAMVRSRNLRLSQILNQWRGPVQTGAANEQVAVLAKDVAAINSLRMLHRKTLHLNNSNSQRRASNNPRVSNQTGKLHGHAAMAPAIVRPLPALKTSPPFSGA